MRVINNDSLTAAELFYSRQSPAWSPDSVCLYFFPLHLTNFTNCLKRSWDPLLWYFSSRTNICGENPNPYKCVETKEADNLLSLPHPW